MTKTYSWGGTDISEGEWASYLDKMFPLAFSRVG